MPNACRTLLLCLAVVLAFGGAVFRSPAERLIGRWQGKPTVPAKTLLPENAADPTGGILHETRQSLEQLAAEVRLSLDIASSGVIDMSLQRKGAVVDRQRGKWQIVESDDARTVLAITIEREGRPVTRQLQLRWDDDNRFLAVEKEGDPRVPPFRFQRTARP